MSEYSTVVAALELIVGDTRAVQILRGFDTDFAQVVAERDAAMNRAAALEAALARSQAEAASLVAMITRVREDAADGVLDDPIPEPTPA